MSHNESLSKNVKLIFKTIMSSKNFSIFNIDIRYKKGNF